MDVREKPREFLGKLWSSFSLPALSFVLPAVRPPVKAAFGSSAHNGRGGGGSGHPLPMQAKILALKKAAGPSSASAVLCECSPSLYIACKHLYYGGRCSG